MISLRLGLSSFRPRKPMAVSMWTVVLLAFGLGHPQKVLQAMLSFSLVNLWTKVLVATSFLVLAVASVLSPLDVQQMLKYPLATQQIISPLVILPSLRARP